MKRYIFIISSLYCFVSISIFAKLPEWEEVYNGLFTYSYYPNIAPIEIMGYDPGKPSNLFLIQEDILYLSTDYGKNWQERKIFYEGGKWDCMLIIDSNLYMSRDDLFIYKSSDYGLNWRQLGPYKYKLQNVDDSLIYGRIVSLQFRDNKIYAGCDGGSFLSTDGMLTCSPLINLPLIDTLKDRRDYYRMWDYYSGNNSIVFKGNSVYLTTLGRGVAFSHDNGITWNNSSKGIHNVDDHFFLCNVGDNFYLNRGDAVFFSKDSALTWEWVFYIKDYSLSGPLWKLWPCGDNIYFDIDSYLYSTKDFRTFNRWDFSYNLYSHTKLLLITNEYIFMQVCGNNGCQLVRAKIKDCEVEIPNEIEEDNKINITNIVLSPNPVQDILEITLGNGKREMGSGKVEVYDILGEFVLKDVQHLAGVGHLIKIDVSSLPPGIYFVLVGDWTGKFVKM